jgi:hypothetical protein
VLGAKRELNDRGSVWRRSSVRRERVWSCASGVGSRIDFWSGGIRTRRWRPWATRKRIRFDGIDLHSGIFVRDDSGAVFLREWRIGEERSGVLVRNARVDLRNELRAAPRDDEKNHCRSDGFHDRTFFMSLK